MNPQHDEEYFVQELARLFDPDRIFAKYSRFGEDDFVKELKQYYRALSPEEQQAFEQATLRWMRSGESRHRTQAIRLCGDLRLKGCVDGLLELGESMQGRSPIDKDLLWVVESLGEIADVRALDFLTKEATEGEYQPGALVGISRIDLDKAVALAVNLVRECYAAHQSPKLTERLFRSLLFVHKGQVAEKLGAALSQFPDKAYLLQEFGKAVQGSGIKGGKWLTKRDKQRTMDAFRTGLEKGKGQDSV